uniref:Uncharacterized protein n=1 Tax=Timema monikensis TaxID=170555 RepID=A0A7R9EE08_9NEOP|nr:unnamed protein product [Timema monikensis]
MFLCRLSSTTAKTSFTHATPKEGRSIRAIPCDILDKCLGSLALLDYPRSYCGCSFHGRFTTHLVTSFIAGIAFIIAACKAHVSSFTFKFMLSPCDTGCGSGRSLYMPIDMGLPPNNNNNKGRQWLPRSAPNTPSSPFLPCPFQIEPLQSSSRGHRQTSTGRKEDDSPLLGDYCLDEEYE